MKVSLNNLLSNLHEVLLLFLKREVCGLLCKFQLLMH